MDFHIGPNLTFQFKIWNKKCTHKSLKFLRSPKRWGMMHTRLQQIYHMIVYLQRPPSERNAKRARKQSMLLIFATVARHQKHAYLATNEKGGRRCEISLRRCRNMHACFYSSRSVSSDSEAYSHSFVIWNDQHADIVALPRAKAVLRWSWCTCCIHDTLA